MRSVLCVLLAILTLSTGNSQDIELNKSFGDNGLFTKAPDERGNAYFEWTEAITELDEGKILSAVNNRKIYLLRYTKNGTVDKTFGTNGMSNAFPIQNVRMEKTFGNKIIFAGTHYKSDKENLKVYRLTSDGLIDSSFGINGIFGSPINKAPKQLLDVTIQPDGKILLLATPRYPDTTKTTQLIRINSEGTLDDSFGTNGTLEISLPDITNFHEVKATNTSIFISFSIASRTGVAAYDMNGVKDINFGQNGIVITEIGSQNFPLIFAQPDGKLLVGNSFTDFGTNEQGFAVQRLLPDGRGDITFYGTGRNRIVVGLGYTTQKKLLVDPAGRIYCVGKQAGYNSIVQVPVIVRFEANGTVDRSFGYYGLATIKRQMNAFEPYDAKILTDGGIGICGSIGNYPQNFYFIGKLNVAGQADKNFGDEGAVESFIPKKNSWIADLKATHNGSLFALYGYIDDFEKRGVIKLFPNGANDSGFSESGFLPSTAWNYDTTKHGGLMTAENDDTYGIENRRLLISRYLPDGKPDFSFGEQGHKSVPLLRSFQLWKYLILPDERMLVYGSFIDQNGKQQFFLTRLTHNGDVDPQFGSNGYVYFMDERIIIPNALMLQPDGKILLAGHEYLNNYSIVQATCLRLLDNGNPDRSFAENGYIKENLSTFFSTVTKFFVSKKGTIVTEIFYYPDNINYRSVVIKYDSNGKKQNNFGQNGELTNLQGTLKLLDDDRILNIVGSIEEHPKSMKLTMYKSNGMLDEDFGLKGTKEISLQQPIQYLNEVIQRGNQLYVTGSVNLEFEDIGAIASLNIIPASESISSFTLLNAKTDTDVQPLQDGDEIDLALIPGNSINIRANTTQPVGSITMKLSGAQTKTAVENTAPYALIGNTGNNYRAWTPQVGSYTLSATPYPKAKGKGEAGTSKTVSFKVVYNLTLSHFTLVNTRTNKDITTLTDGAVIDLAQTPHINIRANTDKGYTESVRFDVNGKQYLKIQSHLPYALATDKGGNYQDWKVQPGTYTITATPYGQDGGKGWSGTPMTITVKIINSKNSSTLNKVAVSSTQEKTKAIASKGLYLTTYPNPAVNQAVAQFSVPRTTRVSVVLVDAAGRRVEQVYKGVAEGGMVHLKTISTAGLRSGLYFCYLITQDGQIKVSKFIKQ